uniref:Putative secreted protein n=1 Tax=Anopheles marajoara TaxID=58244 RepID=A0A2M4CB24_9DIPT
MLIMGAITCAQFYKCIALHWFGSVPRWSVSKHPRQVAATGLSLCHWDPIRVVGHTAPHYRWGRRCSRIRIHFVECVLGNDIG